MRVVVLRNNCPNNEGSCPIGVIVLMGRYPWMVVVLGSNWQRGSGTGGYLSYRVAVPGLTVRRVVVPGVVIPGVVVLAPYMVLTFPHTHP